MKRLIQKASNRLNMPTAMVVSALVHCGLLVLAGLVALTVIKKKPVPFEPPPNIDRPKMELKKPQVKVKRSIKPKASQRITAKNVPTMTAVALPPMGSGAGDLTGGIQGFEMMPDPSEMNLYGGVKSIAVGNDFEGTFYSLALDRSGIETAIDRDNAYELAKSFIEADWNPIVFSRYFRAPEKIYTTHFILPTDVTTVGPDAFGFDDPEFPPGMWLVHYKGKIASPKDGRFRFWGAGDDMFIVRVNGKIVLDASWVDMRGYASGFKPEDSGDVDSTHYLGNTSAKVGHWFKMKEGEPIVMEVIMFNNAFNTNHILLIEDEEEDYDESRYGMPMLPAFKTAEFPEALRTEIEYMTIRGEIDLYSDLMFNVH